MALAPRPLLRFAVGTTLLAPAACTNAGGGERPPIVNTPAPRPPEPAEPTRGDEPPVADTAGAPAEAPPDVIINTRKPDPEPVPLTRETPPSEPTKADRKPNINTAPPGPEPPPRINTAPSAPK